jgi:hypothetical protein
MIALLLFAGFLLVGFVGTVVLTSPRMTRPPPRG